MKQHPKVTIEIPGGMRSGNKKFLRHMMKVIEKHGVTAFGPEFNKILEGGPYATRTFQPSRTSPQASIQKLKDAYKQAWVRRYALIKQKMVTDGGKGQARYTRWKKNKVGKNPYTGPQTISSDAEPAIMTGYLFKSVEEAFESMQDTDHVKFSNISVVGGFSFNPQSYPFRVTPYQGARNVYRDQGGYSYVSRFAQRLAHMGIDNIVEFEQSDWKNISRIMQRLYRTQFLKPLGDEFAAGFGIKIGG